MAVLSGSPDPVIFRVTSTGALAFAAAGALCAAAVLSPNDAVGGPVVCPFRLATGLPCPGCGMTRAWVFLLHGRVGDALSANPFVLVTLPAAIALLLAVVWGLVRAPAAAGPRAGRPVVGGQGCARGLGGIRGRAPARRPDGARQRLRAARHAGARNPGIRGLHGPFVEP